MFAGGAESYAVHLARRLVSEGWEVHLVGHSWDNDPPQAFFHPIRELPRWVPASVRILHFAFAHRRIVRGLDLDVVLGFGNTLQMDVYQSHGGVHRFSTIRKLEAVRNPALRLFKRLSLYVSPKYFARAWIEAAPFRLPRRPIVVAIAEMIRADMAEYFPVPANEIRLVYNGIDLRRFSANDSECAPDLRLQLGLDQRVIFLFMAYDFRKKGVRYLVEAAGRLRSRVDPGAFGVAVVGGSPPKELESLVAGLNLEKTVVFHGPTREPEKLYAACDVFVLPTFYDACSLVVFEAMAAGLPAITSRFNGAAGVITHARDGMVLQNPRDPEELANCMEAFLNEAFLGQASARARMTAQHYTIERNHAQMLAILEEAAERKRTRHVDR